ncbi:lipopolysaccharide biosynthesis [Ruegeria sp. Ofav3-42]|uniref:GumC family protein n=1 Tax=Ruegeria sp. Ofav3-42 TaxID=2917759 RepID=UPI001EF52A9C|nr:lipopolysaccharide biosynthesis [Ruegeria sp. Ofav3-42]MCG7522391.1 lipopolysaccharide biosynthesis [Ruegeria sp. Ofav3-42]
MDLRFYWSIFSRRLPYFMLVATVISAVSIIIAFSLPPAYVSEMKLIVEAPRIPDDLAASTVRTPAQQQLELLEQRLLTRANLIDIANRQRVFPDISEMSPDRIVSAMRARTTVRESSHRAPVPLMQISFEARSGAVAAGVLNEYLNLIQQEDVRSRTARAAQTLEFFEQEVARLSEELAKRNARLLAFKTENSDALPESLDYKLSQQTLLQERQAMLEREIAGLEDQRQNLILIFESTGRVNGYDGAQQSPESRELEDLRRQLSEALIVYSEQNPRVKVLKARIAEMEKTVQPRAEDEGDTTGNALLDVQLAEIATRIDVLRGQQSATQARLEKVTDTINRTPATSIRIEELTQARDNLQQQYNLAVDRLSRASTGERIEVTAQGQRVSVIEPPVVPNRPSKPNRAVIAAGGCFMGILAGLGLVVLLELLNRSVRRPEDLIARLDITPLATIPYIPTPGEIWRRRGFKLMRITIIFITVSAGVYAIHTYYQPLDLVAERVMEKIGTRW